MHQLVNVRRPADLSASPGHPRHLGRVLVVDDSPAMRHRIMDYLNAQPCLAVGCPGGEALRHLRHSPFSLVVLNVPPGPSDGFAMLRRIRACSDVPVILVAGQGCDGADRIAGLELGADDHLGPPLDLRELLARARAILRRQELGRQLCAPRAQGGYRFNGWELRRRMRTLTDPSGGLVPLTKGEYALLLAFLEAPRRTLSREHLLLATRKHEDIFDRSIDVQVLRLRRKLEPGSAGPQLIRTERGAGYIFDADVEVLSGTTSALF